ncbi:MAG: ribosome silencing factor [Acidimicrobiales bacterium]
MSTDTTTSGPELQWVLAAAHAADDKLATDTVIIEVAAVLAITGYFMITSGRNARQVRAIAQEIEQQLTLDDGPKPLGIEGREEAEWLLMDYGDFVIHIFDDSGRKYYDLERLWSDQPRVPWVAPAPSTAEVG